MCSETTPPPRISFSHDLDLDLCQADVEQNEFRRRDSMLLDSNPEFEFSINESSFQRESCSADELFANGLILPVQVQEKSVHKYCSPPPTLSLPPLPPPPSNIDSSKKETPCSMNIGDLEETLKPQAQGQPKSFWVFKRSSSLNHDVKKSLICSLPLLSRSSSTGSDTVPNKRAAEAFKDVYNNKQKPSPSNLQQKPPLKKSYMGSYGNGNGVKISPVLNVPPPYISKGTANLFGFGSFLRSGSSKNKKNKK